MAKFNFYQDVKVQVWNRQFFTIEAETQEEANEIASNFKCDDVTDTDIDEVTLGDNETLFDTQEVIYNDENGNATIEIFDENNKRIFHNGKR